ncbi:hypothetical protein CDAR_13621, partial [Caerostris darwini]
ISLTIRTIEIGPENTAAHRINEQRVSLSRRGDRKQEPSAMCNIAGKYIQLFFSVNAYILPDINLAVLASPASGDWPYVGDAVPLQPLNCRLPPSAAFTVS